MGSQHGRKPPPPPPHSHRGNNGSCCPMVAAGHALRRGKFRLARRHAAWSLRLIVARFA